MVGDGKVIMTSSGYAAETFARFYRSNGKARFFHGGGLGAMGQGLAQGIGAMLSSKKTDERILIVESDGGLMMSLHELATYKQNYQRGSLLINLNNHGYASIYNSQQRHFGYNSGTASNDGLYMPNWEQLVKSFGINYVKFSKKDDLINLDRYFCADEPTFVDYIIEKNENRGPAVKSTIDSKGISSSKLESIDW